MFSQFCPQASGLVRVRRTAWSERGLPVRRVASSGGGLPLITLGPLQAAHCGADPPSGVCAAPAWRGCLSELVHPCGHQREEVRALGPGGDPVPHVLAGRARAGCFSSLHPSLLVCNAGTSKVYRLTSTCTAYTLGSGHLAIPMRSEDSLRNGS